MYLTWLSLLPPCVVIGVMLLTRRLNFSLGLGVVLAAVLVTHGSLLDTLFLLKERFIGHLTDSNNLYLYVSLIAISSLITLLSVTGSAAACAHIIGSKIRTKKSVEKASVLLSFLMSIDDYLSILTVGFVMRPLADKFGIARAKLSYLINSLAGPLVVIVPISTWAATILVQLDNAGIGMQAESKIVVDPLYVYLKTIPFMFYSLFTIACVLVFAITKASYGYMAHEEQMAVAIDNSIVDNSNYLDKSHSLVELLIPLSVLIGGVLFGILYAGNFYVFGGNNSFFEAFRENDQTFLIFLLASLAAFFSSVFLSLWKKYITLAHIPGIVIEGFVSMKSAITMVVLASVLGSFLRLDLHTGNYVAYLLLGKAPLYCMPALLFVTALTITLTTGSAWGTFSLLIPIAVQMLIAFTGLSAPITIDQLPILLPTLAGLLSGAVCGNHISPFAETTVMTGSSVGIDFLKHARIQFSYAMPVVLGSFIAFIIAGLCAESPFLFNAFVSGGVGFCACFMAHVVNSRIRK